VVNKREKVVDGGSIYFPPSTIQFVSSGCTILDCVLGGGWALGRVCNIVGDRSTAKTALATEAVINFLKQFPDGAAFYRETEAAFDKSYATSMGLPIDRVDFGNDDEPLMTVEEFGRDLDKFIEQQVKAGKPGIYVLDSLDALSDEAEMERDIGEGTYGMQKAKNLSILLRKTARKLERTKILLLVVSQVRENIGISFGEKYRRSGGKALDFYASQVLWLAHIKTLKRTINKVERPYGVIIKGKTKKNKVAMPFRECEFPFIFSYGVEDLVASMDWLKSVGKLEALNINQDVSKISDEEYKQLQQQVAETVRKTWAEIEQKFMPVRSKYK
jgi:recombination protein RecA